MGERLTRSIQIFFICAMALTFVSGGCAVRSSAQVDAPPVKSTAPSVTRHCPDRVERASTGGLVGGVAGLVAASLIGSPFIAGAYKLAGYVIGFASADPCYNGDPALGATPSEEKARPSVASKIAEENL